MARLKVRVVPRSAKRSVERKGDEVVIRVQTAPVEGRATEEARRVLAERLGVPASRVSVRSGARARVKILDVEGLSEEDLLSRLSGS